jgi:hypothetical protein
MSMWSFTQKTKHIDQGAYYIVSNYYLRGLGESVKLLLPFICVYIEPWMRSMNGVCKWRVMASRDAVEKDYIVDIKQVSWETVLEMGTT